MDYSQFNAFMDQNGIYDQFINRIQSELIYNKVTSQNKTINFEEFLIILLEFSKVAFTWEKDFLKSFNYFINKYIIHIPCLVKTMDEKNMERWYFFLENAEFIKEVKKHMNYFYKIFFKYKVKDLKVSTCTNISNFLTMCKDKSIIPVFLSTKDVISVTIIYLH
jgi:hypothetical protein